VVPIIVPPLRERREDIPLLIRHFMKVHSEEQGLRIKEISPEAMAVFQQYDWPGNIRELRNLIERLMIMVPGDSISAADLVFLGQSDAAARPDAAAAANERLTLHEARDRFERDLILRTLAEQQGNMSRTAEALGVERSNLYRKMRAFGIAPARRAEEEEAV